MSNLSTLGGGTVKKTEQDEHTSDHQLEQLAYAFIAVLQHRAEFGPHNKVASEVMAEAFARVFPSCRGRGVAAQA